MNRDETRITSETGAEKCSKLAQLSSLDPHALIALAEVSGLGAQKYSPHNFLRGGDWSLWFDAAQRHLLAFWGGEDLDPESGQQHLAHAAWHCLAMLAFVQRGIGTDTRPLAPMVAPPVDPTVNRWRDRSNREWIQRDGAMIFLSKTPERSEWASWRTFEQVVERWGPLTPVAP